MTIRYHRHEDLRMTELDDEGVVLHLGSRCYFTVSETGVVLLEALEQQRSVDDLVEYLLERYEVSREQASESVRQFLDKCTQAKLVTSDRG